MLVAPASADFVFSQPLMILVKSTVRFMAAIRNKHYAEYIFDQVSVPQFEKFEALLEEDDDVFAAKSFHSRPRQGVTSTTIA